MFWKKGFLINKQPQRIIPQETTEKRYRALEISEDETLSLSDLRNHQIIPHHHKTLSAERYRLAAEILKDHFVEWDGKGELDPSDRIFRLTNMADQQQSSDLLERSNTIGPGTLTIMTPRTPIEGEGVVDEVMNDTETENEQFQDLETGTEEQIDEDDVLQSEGFDLTGTSNPKPVAPVVVLESESSKHDQEFIVVPPKPVLVPIVSPDPSDTQLMYSQMIDEQLHGNASSLKTPILTTIPEESRGATGTIPKTKKDKSLKRSEDPFVPANTTPAVSPSQPIIGLLKINHESTMKAAEHINKNVATSFDILVKNILPLVQSTQSQLTILGDTLKNNTDELTRLSNEMGQVVARQSIIESEIKNLNGKIEDLTAMTFQLVTKEHTSSQSVPEQPKLTVPRQKKQLTVESQKAFSDYYLKLVKQELDHFTREELYNLMAYQSSQSEYFTDINLRLPGIAFDNLFTQGCNAFWGGNGSASVLRSLDTLFRKYTPNMSAATSLPIPNIKTVYSGLPLASPSTQKPHGKMFSTDVKSSFTISSLLKDEDFD